MQRLIAALLCLTALPALAGGERAGGFDHYALSLGWSPTWCATTGDARGAPECDAGQSRGFLLHGLWPQYAMGWPSDCRTSQSPPSRADTGAMADIMGSGGLAWHEWKKHGTCSGLSADAYFAASRAAFAAVTIPPYFQNLHKRLNVMPDIVAQAFLRANPQLGPDMISVSCSDGMIAEVRICLAPDLTPQPCTESEPDHCGRSGAVMEPER